MILSHDIVSNWKEKVLVKCLGTMRPDGSDSLLPAKHMPFGLIQHCVNFFSSASQSTVFLNVIFLFCLY